MMRVGGAVLVAVLLTVWGPTDATAGQDGSRGGPMEIVTAFVRANEQGDLDRTVATFADDATAFLPAVPPQRATGKAAIRDAFRRLYGQRTGAISITLTEVNVQESGDTAIVTAHLGAVPALPVAQPTTVARRTFVLRRSGTRWLIVHLHASNVLVAPPTK